MQKAFQAHNVSIVPGGGAAQLVFKNYAQPGDQMTIAFDMATKKIQTLNVNTYMGEAKDVVTLAVQFASLPDGTNYAAADRAQCHGQADPGNHDQHQLHQAGAVGSELKRPHGFVILCMATWRCHTRDDGHGRLEMVSLKDSLEGLLTSSLATID